MSKPDLADYNTVAERLTEFRTKYPDGRLRPLDDDKPYTIEKIGNEYFVSVVACAYRTADDPTPAVGMAWEPFPGRTPYTKGSELQNAETSAWGRAIVAALAAETNRGIASREEVRNRDAERSGVPAVLEAFQETTVENTDQARSQLRKLIAGRLISTTGWTAEQIQADFLTAMGVPIADADIDVLTRYHRSLAGDGHGS